MQRMRALGLVRIGTFRVTSFDHYYYYCQDNGALIGEAAAAARGRASSGTLLFCLPTTTSPLLHLLSFQLFCKHTLRKTYARKLFAIATIALLAAVENALLFCWRK